MFGVSYVGEGVPGLSFVSPKNLDILCPIWPQQHLIHQGGQLAIAAQSAEVLATQTLPYYPADAGTALRPSFASIHSNPPGPTGSDPALTSASFGKGQVVYAAGAIEAESTPVNRAVMTTLVRRLLGGPARVEAEAPSFVELTVLDKPERGKMNISLVGLREDEDCLPCSAKVTVQMGDRTCTGLKALPEYVDHTYAEAGGVLTFEVAGLEILRMFEVGYE